MSSKLSKKLLLAAAYSEAQTMFAVGDFVLPCVALEQRDSSENVGDTAELCRLHGPCVCLQADRRAGGQTGEQTDILRAKIFTEGAILPACPFCPHAHFAHTYYILTRIILLTTVLSVRRMTVSGIMQLG